MAAGALGLGPSPFLPVVATIAFVVVSGPTSFPSVVVACYGPEVGHAHGQQLGFGNFFSERSVADQFFAPC